jgi:lipoate-protein ligase A
MYCIILESHNAFFNLAIEEVLLKNSIQEFLILGINDPTLIIGKHQSAHREVNTKFITENNIPVIRRISGGGTVFHDNGNLNFTFIRQSEEGKQIDFRKHTRPVISFLSTLGIEALFEGKNDLRVNGLKVSGNAEHVHRNRILHHGTLLFSTSLDMLGNSLRKDKSCYSSRAVESNPSSVMNLREELPEVRDIYEFRAAMKDFLMMSIPDMERYELTHKEHNEAESLAESKYKSWEWNWAYGPEYHFSNQFILKEKEVSCRLFVKDGIIRECELSGQTPLVTTGKKLNGCRHMVEDMLDIFRKEKIQLTREEIFNFF